MIDQYTQWARSKGLRYSICILACAFALLLAFQAGIFIGFRKAESAHRFGDGYTRVFRGPDRAMGGMPLPPDFPDSHGVVGTLVSVSAEALVVASPDKTERTARLSTTTEIRRFRETLNAADLAVGDAVIVFGDSAVDGTISARLIRIIPSQGIPQR